MAIDVRIHYYKNEKWGRYHLPWITQFSEYIKKYHTVELKDYYKGDGKWDGPIDLQEPILFNRAKTTNPGIGDTDFIIENLNNNEIVVVTFCKFFHHRMVHWMKDPKVKAILCAHYSSRFFAEHYTRNNSFEYANKVKPFIFGFFHEFDVDTYREVRDNTEKLNPNLFFKGGGVSLESYRSVVYHLMKKGMLESHSVPHPTYLELLAKQGIAFSHYLDLNLFRSATENCGELCYRDMEMMSIGVPYIRVEYKSELHEAFLPNYHYICVPREDAFLAFEEGGDEAVADLVIKKYNEVKDNKPFLEFISKNQRNWYDKNMRFPKSAELVRELSGMINW